MNQTTSSKKILIVYLTRTGNTEAIAHMIHDEIGGMVVGLELENPYPENYQAQVSQVVEENASGYLPPLKTAIANMQDYDTVFVGAPTWDMQLPPPMKSLLSAYDLGGKTIIPFNTNAGYGVGSSFETVKELCPNSTILEGLSVEGGRERDGIMFVMEGDKAIQVKVDIQKWLQRIGLGG
jgi:flavodoxin